MLLFEREDAQSDVWLWACRKFGYQANLVRSLQPDIVNQKMVDLKPNLIVVDRRLANRTAETDNLCR